MRITSRPSIALYFKHYFKRNSMARYVNTNIDNTYYESGEKEFH